MTPYYSSLHSTPYFDQRVFKIWFASGDPRQPPGHQCSTGWASGRAMRGEGYGECLGLAWVQDWGPPSGLLVYLQQHILISGLGELTGFCIILIISICTTYVNYRALLKWPDFLIPLWHFDKEKQSTLTIQKWRWTWTVFIHKWNSLNPLRI